jgi:hypothetical protein
MPDSPYRVSNFEFGYALRLYYKYNLLLANLSLSIKTYSCNAFIRTVILSSV